MTYRQSLLIMSAVLVALAFAAHSEASDIKVMVVIGLLDYGEDAKVMSVSDFNKYKPDYNDFRKLMDRSVTLREMVKKGWRVVDFEPITDDYFIVMLESG